MPLDVRERVGDVVRCPVEHVIQPVQAGRIYVEAAHVPPLNVVRLFREYEPYSSVINSVNGFLGGQSSARHEKSSVVRQERALSAIGRPP
ncbi:hypothetical protein GCM10028790_19630 [Micromonospora taraxaci]